MRDIFFRSALTIPQLEGTLCATAVPQLFKEMLLRNCISAHLSLQFLSAVRNFFMEMMLRNFL
jgi:hypothetical protein